MMVWSRFQPELEGISTRLSWFFFFLLHQFPVRDFLDALVFFVSFFTEIISVLIPGSDNHGQGMLFYIPPPLTSIY